jgi:hypothetical protein
LFKFKLPGGFYQSVLRYETDFDRLFERKNYQSIEEVIKETEIMNKVREIVERARLF